MIIKNENGATAVELALILLVLILLLNGIIELGLLLFNKQVITNASREGARAGIVSRAYRFTDDDASDPDDGDPVDVDAATRNWTENHLVTFGGTGVPQVDVEILDKVAGTPDEWSTIDEAKRCTGFKCPLTVRVTYNYHFLVLSIFGFGPKTLVAETTMLME